MSYAISVTTCAAKTNTGEQDGNWLTLGNAYVCVRVCALGRDTPEQ